MLGNTESYQTSEGPRSGLGCGTTSPEAWVVTQQILWHMKLSAVWENMQCMMEFMAIPVKESQHKTIWLQSKAMRSAVEKYNFWEVACYWALVDPECLTMSTKYCVPYKLSQNHQDIKLYEFNSSLSEDKNSTSETGLKQDQRDKAAICTGSTDLHVTQHGCITAIPPTCTYSHIGRTGNQLEEGNAQAQFTDGSAWLNVCVQDTKGPWLHCRPKKQWPWKW